MKLTISKNANINYLARIVQVDIFHPHPNADKLKPIPPFIRKSLIRYLKHYLNTQSFQKNITTNFVHLVKLLRIAN